MWLDMLLYEYACSVHKEQLGRYGLALDWLSVRGPRKTFRDFPASRCVRVSFAASNAFSVHHVLGTRMWPLALPMGRAARL